MARTYTLNADSAKSVGQSSYINQTGRYVGHFTLAKAVRSTKGTDGIEFSFATDDGRSADYLQLWTHNEAGEELMGGRILNALMTCMKVREMKASVRNVQGRNGTEAADVFADLMGKRVGLVLQREAICKKDGSEGYRMNIYMPFEAATGLSAREVLDKKVAPEDLDKILAGVKDRPMSEADKRRQAQIQGGGGAAYAYDSPKAAAAAAGGGVAGMDDDIPFAPIARRVGWSAI